MTLSVTHSTVTGAAADSTALVDGVAWDAAHTLSGTASAAQLNENVVQSVTNDTNVTGAISAQVLTLGWTSTLSPARGGTGIASYAVGDLLYASGATTLAKLADVATGNALISGGVATAPSWGKIGLTTHISGTLAVGNGGTGLTSATQGDILYASAADTLAKLAKDTNATRYLSNTGTSNNPAWAQVNLANGVTGTLPVANGGTGQTTEAEAIGEMIQALTEDTGPDWSADYVGSYDGSADTGKKLLLSTFTREKLSASRTYYVRTDGSDSNTGLANTSGAAFLTIQKAINVVAALDIGTNTVTINVEDGTYTAGVTVSGPWVGTGTVQLTGDTTTPSNAVISTTSADAIYVHSAGRLSVAGFKLQTTTGGTGVLAAYGGAISINGNMEYGACATAHMRSLDGGRITFGAYTVSGNAPLHYDANGAGSSIRGQGVGTITISGTPAFSTAFARALSLGALTANGNTYSGSATGTRYSATLNAVINTAGGGASYFPGDVAGSTATGGQYA